MFKISVNADDFGSSSLVNRAVVECMSSGLVTNATIMANMPGFVEACDLAHDHGFEDRIGVHLNLSEGMPLTDAIKRNHTFCTEDGCFAYHRQGILFSRADRECVAKEIGAQVATCRRNGLTGAHIDSHRHIHTNFALFRLFEPLLEDLGVRRVRLSANMHDIHPLRKLYKYGFNKYLSFRGFQTSRYFGDVASFRQTHLKAHDNVGTCEIMVHPGYSAEGELVDTIGGRETLMFLREIVKEYRIIPFHAL